MAGISARFTSGTNNPTRRYRYTIAVARYQAAVELVRQLDVFRELQQTGRLQHHDEVALREAVHGWDSLR